MEYLDQDVTDGSSPTFGDVTINNLIVDGKDMMKWAVLQG
jgi:hypothetical protein